LNFFFIIPDSILKIGKKKKQSLSSHDHFNEECFKYQVPWKRTIHRSIFLETLIMDLSYVKLKFEVK